MSDLVAMVGNVNRGHRMNLVDSSEPDAVRRDEVRRHYAERVVLTTAVCHEARREQAGGDYRRVVAALSMLRCWIYEAYDISANELNEEFTHGLHDVALAKYCPDFLLELTLGGKVCNAYAWLMTADAGLEFERGLKDLEAALDRFFAEATAPQFDPRSSR